MKRTGFGLVILLSAALAAPIAARSAGSQAGPQSRTIYVSISDKETGKPIPGLTAADFKVKDGKDREITSVTAPTTRAKLAVLIEEALAPDTSTRQAILTFAQRMVKTADIAIVSVGNKNTIVVDHTSDLQKILAGLNSTTMVQMRQSNHMADGISEAARVFQQTKPERPIMVALALEIQSQSGESPDKVLNDLRLSRAVLEAVAVEFGGGQQDLSGTSGGRAGTPGAALDTVEASKVVGEGPKQSGGRRIGITSSRAIPTSLMKVADDIDAQYAITYVLPAGDKPQDRISVTTTKKNVTLLAPTRVNQN